MRRMEPSRSPSSWPVQAVGDAAAVARGDVEAAVGAEREAAAVVAERGPLDDHALAPRVAAWRVARADLQPRDAHRPRPASRRLDAGRDEQVAVPGELRVQGQAEEVPPEVEHQLGLPGLRVVGERIDLAVPLGHEHAVASRREGHRQRLGELQPGEGRLRAVGRGRIGRPADPRGRPRHPLLQPVRLPGAGTIRRFARPGRRPGCREDTHEGEASEEEASRRDPWHGETPRVKTSAAYSLFRSIGRIGSVRTIRAQVESSSPRP